MKKIILILCLLVPFSACKDYLELVPDNIATINSAFSLRNTAERFLFTCYDRLPNHGSLANNPALTAGGELWRTPERNLLGGMIISLGLQRASSPVFNEWDGNGFDGIRDCNIFLENIGSVPDIDESERKKWIAEVKVIKAYLHFNLMRMYGPIPIIRENLPIDVDLEETKVSRRPVDEVMTYIVSLIDESIPDLPLEIYDLVNEYGRITKPIAATIKADALTYAASPIFNGNTDYMKLKNPDGTQLINPVHSVEKWQLAAMACKEAIELCEQSGLELYDFEKPEPTQAEPLSATTITKMSIRNSVAEREDNYEVIWANTGSRFNQSTLTPISWDPEFAKGGFPLEGDFAPPIQVMDLFYSKNGVPIDEDKGYNFPKRYSIQIAGADQAYNVISGYETIQLHIDRELRFYASVAIDGGYWFGQGKKRDDDMWRLDFKLGGTTRRINAIKYSVSGYSAKKLINYTNVISKNSYKTKDYPWPVYRLADLYLLYAEAQNEAYGPEPEVYKYINKVRKRAGLEDVEIAWPAYSTKADKYTTQAGLREIIHQERGIELIFEGKRYWDLKRWKKAHIELNKTITGWATKTTTVEEFYNQELIAVPLFRQRDYLWRISESSLLRNRNLVQNIGW